MEKGGCLQRKKMLKSHDLWTKYTHMSIPFMMDEQQGEQHNYPKFRCFKESSFSGQKRSI